MLATETTRRSPWGSEIPAELVRDFIKAGIRASAVADFVAEYAFEALAAGEDEPPDLADALRTAFDEVLAASTREDWEQVGRDLVADARDCLELPMSPRTPSPASADWRWRREPEGGHARGRRDTANRFIDAFEALRSEPGIRPTNTRVAERAHLAKETLYQQFGRIAGLSFAANARRALRLPALWADRGFAEARTPLAQIRATAREYLRLAIEEPAATEALLHPDAIVDLLAPKDLRRYRTLQELVYALKSRVADQDRLLGLALATPAAFVDGAPWADPQQTLNTLNAAWIGIATQAWQSPPLDEPELFRQISEATNAILERLTPASGAS